MATPPIRDFRATEDGEWYVSGGKFEAIGGPEAVPQGIRIRVSFFKSECYLDEEVGVPYVDDILVKSPDPLIVRAVIQEAISKTPDVTDVVGAQLVQEPGSRDASISYEAATVYGEQTVVGQIEVPV